MHAESAFFHDSLLAEAIAQTALYGRDLLAWDLWLFPVEAARVVGTGCFTVTAANAPVIIDRHDAVRLFPRRFDRANVDARRRTILGVAASNGRLAAVRSLCELGANQELGGGGLTPLLWAAIGDHFAVVQYLVEKAAAKVDAADPVTKLDAAALASIRVCPHVSKYLAAPGRFEGEAGLVTLKAEVAGESSRGSVVVDGSVDESMLGKFS